MYLTDRAAIRQFSRAVFADRLIGDELTRLALAKIERKSSESPSLLADLMRAFIQEWRHATSKAPGDWAPFSDDALLGAIPPPPGEARLMLLLVDVIGFSVEEAGTILAPMAQPADEALTLGRQLISLPREAKALIIEDEPLIAADIRSLLVEMGVDVCAEVSNAADAIEKAANMTPDIILADYNLEGDETGVDAVVDIQDGHDCPVIFITGYPQRVLTGDELEPDFVLAKPYRPESVQAAVAHCLDVTREAGVEA